MKFIDLFAGIGGFRIGFQRAGATCVWSCEKDRFARQTYIANHGDTPTEDITTINAESVPEHDILCAGFPCQPFSVAGKGLGFSDDRGNLFLDIVRILEHHKPRAFLLENVVGLIKHNKGRTFDTILTKLARAGYRVHARGMNSESLTPQSRNRIFLIGFRDNKQFNFPTLSDDKLKFGTVKEPTVDGKFTLSDRTWMALQNHAAKHASLGNGFGYSLITDESTTRTLTSRYYKDGSEILVAQGGQNPRRLTPRECARLMGFPDSFKITVSDTQAYKQFGNSVVVPLVELLAKSIVNHISQ